MFLLMFSDFNLQKLKSAEDRRRSECKLSFENDEKCRLISPFLQTNMPYMYCIACNVSSLLSVLFTA